MISKAFLERVRDRLQRDQDLPLGSRLRSGAVLAASYVRETAAGLYDLRECDEVGVGARVIGGHPCLDNRGFLALGKHVKLQCYVAPVAITTGTEGRIEIGDNVNVNFGTYISAKRLVRIGSGTRIGPYTVISDTETSDADSSITPPEPIEIGQNVWLAARVTIMPGSTIGAGSVIAAGSVVSGAIPPGVVARGIPARPVRRIEEPAPLAPGFSTSDLAPLSTRRPPALPAFHGLIVSDFTTADLAQRLNTDREAPRVSFEMSAFGQVFQTLVELPANTDTLFVWTRPQAAVPSFGRVLDLEQIDIADLLSEVDTFADLVTQAAKSQRCVMVATWTIAPYERAYGMLDARIGGATRALCAMNLRLMERLDAVSNVFVLNAQRWLESAGRNAQHPKLWYMGKVPFHPDVFGEAVRDVKATLSGISGATRKLLVLDLDDTLWGGIVGDVGWENLRLGGHDSVGEAFVDFQRAIKSLKRRGVVLAIASKNEESVALEAMKNHPEMVLREDDFAARRINWNDKAKNIAELVAELNLGLQSVVFIDDNPVERARVKEALPELLVPEWPEDKLLYASTLRGLRCFDGTAVTREDLERTQMYAAQGQRESLKARVSSVEDWLKSLRCKVRSSGLNPANVARTTQLLNKTNQMNLSTRRLTEAELVSWAKNPDRELHVVSVSDRFGDAGLTGIVSIEVTDGVAKLVDFVLSCRVMGRKVEETLVHIAVEAARRRGMSRLEARYVETSKNMPCLAFWQRSGFTREGNLFSWDSRTPYPRPDVIELGVDE